MIISFDCKCKELENLLKRVDFEDRDFALSHLLYSSILQCITYDIERHLNEDEEISFS